MYELLQLLLHACWPCKPMYACVYAPAYTGLAPAGRLVHAAACIAGACSLADQT